MGRLVDSVEMAFKALTARDHFTARETWERTQVSVVADGCCWEFVSTGVVVFP